MQKFKKTPIFAIYTPPRKGATYDKTTKNFRELYNKGGVYCIFKRMKSGKISAIYIGSSTSSAAKSCLRHFYFYNDARDRAKTAGGGALRVSFEKEKADPKRFFVMFVYIDKPAKELTADEKTKIEDKEKELVQKLQPIFNTNLKTGKFDPDLALAAELENEARSAYGKYNEYKKEYQKFEEQKEKTGPEIEPLKEPPF